MIRACIVPAVAGVVLCSSALASAQTPQQTAEGTRPAVVKLYVDGWDANDNSKQTVEGSGFVVYSDRGITLIVTAAHVIGSSQTVRELNPDWFVNDLDRTIKRTIRVHGADANGTLIERSAAAAVLGQDDARDVAVLSIQASGLRRIEQMDSLQDLQGNIKSVMALGFERGARSVGLESGRGSLGLSDRSGFGYMLDFRVAAGRSGGPVVDETSGRVAAVVSRDIGNSGRHEAVPIAFAFPILNVVFEKLGIERPQTAFLRRTGQADVSVHGTTGALSRRPTGSAALNAWADARGGGAERSECSEGSGRTISSADARAQVSEFAADGLRFEYDLRAQGGHYRVASRCLGDKLLGISGRNTEASAQASLRGEIVFNATEDKDVVVEWKGMPQRGVRYAVRRLDADAAEMQAIAGDGRSKVTVEAGKTYRLELDIRETVDNSGSCCPRRETIDGRIRVIR